MDILKLAFKLDPQKASKIMKKINYDDKKINNLLKKLSWDFTNYEFYSIWVTFYFIRLILGLKVGIPTDTLFIILVKLNL